jgi:DNA-binding transcriptional MocR family regulator
MASRALSPGERLPSIRGFAATMGVSPSTVVEAYDRLAAEGVIRSRLGSGFYVSGAMPPLALAEVEPRLDRAIDPFWVSRQSLDAGTEMLKPGCGWLPADWMPNDAIRRAIRRLAHADDAVLADYGGTRGSLPLRRLLARRFADEGIAAGADQILLTASGTQAAYVHETDRHFHQSGHLRFNHSRHFARATAGPAPWGGACRWRLT